VSAAGAKSQLVNHPLVELVGPADLDRARVALVISDEADEATARVVRAIQRDAIPKVVLVASRFDEEGVVAVTAAGVTEFLRRADATSNRLGQVIHDVDESGCRLPEGLRRRAATACPPDPAPTVIDLTESGGGGVATVAAALSVREAEVLRLVSDGYDTTEIAEKLAYSESTIKGDLAKVMDRFRARNRCHAVAIAVREGLI
jgi:DNA-binding NarL/FixJ family response regulator